MLKIIVTATPSQSIDWFMVSTVMEKSDLCFLAPIFLDKQHCVAVVFSARTCQNGISAPYYLENSEIIRKYNLLVLDRS